MISSLTSITRPRLENNGSLSILTVKEAAITLANRLQASDETLLPSAYSEMPLMIIHSMSRDVQPRRDLKIKQVGQNEENRLVRTGQP